MSFNVNHIDMATAANSDGNISKDFGNLSTNVDNVITDSIITIPLPKACVYDDGENPKLDPDECEEIGNNEETLGRDNIFFTLVSPRSFDSSTCILQDRDAGIVINSFDCTISHNVAEADFLNLEDGDYTFTVTAQRTISDNNPLTPDIVEEAESPPFNFRVGIGGVGTDIGDFDESTFTGMSQFEALLKNEKLGFINLEKKLKNNELINTTSLACLSSRPSDFEDRIEYREFNCNRLFIIATTSPTSTSVSNMSEKDLLYSNDMYIYKVNNALSNGINGDLVSCGLTEPSIRNDEDKAQIIDFTWPIPCRNIFIAYEISS